MRNTWLIVSAAGLSFLGADGTRSAEAQEKVMRERSRATVALVDQLPERQQHYDALVVQSRNTSLILLPRGRATVEVFDSAVRSLLFDNVSQRSRPRASRARERGEVVLGIRRSTAPADWASRNHPRAQRVVDSLRVAPLRSVGRFGRARTVSFYLPRVSSGSFPWRAP